MAAPKNSDVGKPVTVVTNTSKDRSTAAAKVTSTTVQKPVTYIPAN